MWRFVLLTLFKGYFQYDISCFFFEDVDDIVRFQFG